MVVTVWRIDLDAPGLSEFDRLCWLDRQEKQRFGGFVRARDASRFAAAHTASREILGNALGCQPDAIVFEYGTWGRPSVKASEIDFSLTHSGGTALVAISAAGPMGIDMELISRRIGMGTVALFATARERARLTEGLDPERDALHLWVAKEAVLKASGRGFSAEPRLVTIGFADGHPRGVALDLTETPRFWHLVSVVAGPDVFAVLATRQRMDWPGGVLVRRYRPRAARVSPRAPVAE